MKPKFFLCVYVCIILLISRSSFVYGDNIIEEEKDRIIKRYLKESQLLYDSFIKIYDRLSNEEIVDLGGFSVANYIKWEQEYYQPLFKEAEKAMERVSGTSDYLEMWENNVPQIILEKIETQDQDHLIRFPFLRPYITTRRVSLLELCSLSIIYKNRDKILKGTIYEDSDEGDKRRNAIFTLNPTPIIPAIRRYSIVENEFEKESNYLMKIGIHYPFPPRHNRKFIFDISWHAMAIYSFKNERSNKILYKVATESDIRDKIFQRNMLSDFSAYFFTLSNESSEDVNKLDIFLKELLAAFQFEHPDIYFQFFDENQRLTDESMMVFYKVYSEYYHKAYERKEYEIFYKLEKIKRIFVMKRTIEFNKLIPKAEMKRFDIVLREALIASFLFDREKHVTEYNKTIIKKGEENFIIYVNDYDIVNMSRYFESRFFDFIIVDEENHTYREIDKSYWDDNKLLYEAKLNNDDSIFTERQKAFIREKIQL